MAVICAQKDNNFTNLIKGFIGTELQGQTCHEVAPNVYFYNEGYARDVINQLESKGIILTDKFGSMYLFECNTILQ